MIKASGLLRARRPRIVRMAWTVREREGAVRAPALPTVLVSCCMTAIYPGEAEAETYAECPWRDSSARKGRLTVCPDRSASAASVLS